MAAAAPVTLTYLVLVHAEPAQFARLLERLLSGTADRVVVHVDSTADQAQFEARSRAFGDRVRYLDRRQNIRWGDFAVCRATLDAMRLAVEHPADYVVLLSGADYPIQPIARLRDELTSGAVYLESAPMPESNKPMTRLSRYSVAAKRRTSRTARIANKVLLRFPPRSVARGLGGRRPYGGSQWWALPRDVTESILRFTESEHRFVRFFRWSRNPDEMFFQTIVMALHPEREIRHPLTYADWSRNPVAGSPATLTSADLPALRAAAGESFYFARKFDWALDRAVYDLLDEGAVEPA